MKPKLFISKSLPKKPLDFFVSHLLMKRGSIGEGGFFVEGEFTWKGFLLERRVETFPLLSFFCFEGQLLVESPTWRVEPIPGLSYVFFQFVWRYLSFVPLWHTHLNIFKLSYYKMQMHNLESILPNFYFYGNFFSLQRRNFIFLHKNEKIC